MIVIDTNVVSEMMRGEPNSTVLTWADSMGRLNTTAITLAEVEYGIARLPGGYRKVRMAETAARVFADFAEVILSFDSLAAHHYAGIVAGRDKAGHPIATADAQIAAICASRNATLATRNTADFVGIEISLVNPWIG